MKRIYSAYAYGPGPRLGCWWDETIDAPDWPRLDHDTQADIAIIGAGFTGVSAALHLAHEGASVVLLEAETLGWGASGRNGGFCCLGGARLDSARMKKRYGDAETRLYDQAETAAVQLVADLLRDHDIQADTHSNGETLLAHSARAMAKLRGRTDGILTERDGLADLGMNGPFHGAFTIPVGFGLNPRKYLFGLAAAARRAGARMYQHSAVRQMTHTADGHILRTNGGTLRAKTVLIATNGYSSEDIPQWMAARYLPTQSSVLVTRPITPAEQRAQGWTSNQMAYDSRNLLHYFRLMPDGRFLFGMRGGLTSSPRSEAAARRKTRRDFERMFPAWAAIPSLFSWSGLVCLSRRQVPFVGAVPGTPGLFAGFAYHGNGVAMGSYCGRLLADLMLGRTPDLPCPQMMMQPADRFPLGRARRLLMPPVYAAMRLADL